MYAFISLMIPSVMIFSIFWIANFWQTQNYTEGSLILALISCFTLEMSGLIYCIGKCF